MPQESIEIQMLKQQVQLLQQELQSVRQYGNIRTLWNSIFSKLETMAFTSQQPLYQQLMFRISQDHQISQDASCQTDDVKHDTGIVDKIQTWLCQLQQEYKTHTDKEEVENLNVIEKCLNNLKIHSKQKKSKSNSKVRTSLQSLSLQVPTTVIHLSSKENVPLKPISNLESEIKDNQIQELRNQNKHLKQEIQQLQLMKNQLSTQLEEKEAKLKLLNFMVLNQQQKNDFGQQPYNLFRI